MSVFPKARFFLLFSALALFAGCKEPPKDMLKVPKGEFIMGSNEVDREAKALQYGSRRPWYANERPERKVSLDEFHIDRTEVTNRQYKEYVDAKGARPPAHWQGSTYPGNIADHPVVFVTWHDAEGYCKWKGKRLPTEAEWEKAARGADGRNFPWGNEFENRKLNTMGEYGGTVPVGTFPDGASPYGALEMAGNAQEWVSDWYQAYPGNDYKDPDYGEKMKVVRGGGWGGMGHYTLQVYVRTATRNMAPPDGVFDDVGFRCAWP